MQELLFLRSARRLMLIDICMTFREDSFRGFQVTEQTRFVTDKRTDGRTDARGKTICRVQSPSRCIFHNKRLNQNSV